MDALQKQHPCDGRKKAADFSAVDVFSMRFFAHAAHTQFSYSTAVLANDARDALMTFSSICWMQEMM